MVDAGIWVQIGPNLGPTSNRRGEVMLAMVIDQGFEAGITPSQWYDRSLIYTPIEPEPIAQVTKKLRLN